MEKLRLREIKAAIYARVSSSDQKGDLEKQIQYLTRYCSAKDYRVVDVLSDVASDLRTNRRGLSKLFEYVVGGKVNVVVVTCKDRLARFEFEYLEYLFKQYGVRVEIIYGEEAKDDHQELVEDLIAIVTSFAKLYGMGSHRKKKPVQGFQETPRRG